MIPTLIDDFEGFKTTVKEVIADMVGKRRKLELEMKPEDVAVLLQPHNKSLKPIFFSRGSPQPRD